MFKRQLNSPETEVSQAEKLRKMPNNEIKELLESFRNEFMVGNNELKEEVKKIGEEVKKNGEKLATLLERIENNEKEVAAIKAEMAELDARLNYRDQKDLIDHFRVTGLPPLSPLKGETAILMTKIMQKVGVICTAQDFSFCVMKHNKNNSGSVIFGKFSSSNKREEAFRAFRTAAKAEPITWNKFAPVVANDPNGLRKLYLSSFLTNWTMALLNKAREHRGTTFEYVWETGTRIMVRKATGQPAIEIRSPGQLQKLVTQHMH